MRYVVAALALAVPPAAAVAQTGPYLATVETETARMRSGPSDSYPDAGTLYRGTRVLVDHELDGKWLAIQAPPGSVSWVQMTFLDFDASKPKPQNAAVVDDATLLAGRIGHPEPLPEVQRVKVPAGTVLAVIGEKAVSNGKTWYPVAPPAGDFRYVPKSAVQASQAINTSFSVRDTSTSTPTPAGGTTPTGIAAPAGGFPTSTPTAKPAPTATVNHPLWAQAEAAERDGKYKAAEDLFTELARQMREPGGDHDVANLCYSRLHSLRAKQRGETASTPPARDDRTTLAPPAPRGTVSLPAAAKDARPAATGEWMKPGMLVRANIAIDRQPTYALESSPGIIVAYVVAAPGLELERFRNRRVAVFGTKSERNLSRPLVVATAVEPHTN